MHRGRRSSSKHNDLMSPSANIYGSWRASSANPRPHPDRSQKSVNISASSSRRNADDEGQSLSRVRKASASLPHETLPGVHPATGAAHHRSIHQEISFMRIKIDLLGMHLVPATDRVVTHGNSRWPHSWRLDRGSHHCDGARDRLGGAH